MGDTVQNPAGNSVESLISLTSGIEMPTLMWGIDRTPSDFDLSDEDSASVGAQILLVDELSGQDKSDYLASPDQAASGAGLPFKETIKLSRKVAREH